MWSVSATVGNTVACADQSGSSGQASMTLWKKQLSGAVAEAGVPAPWALVWESARPPLAGERGRRFLPRVLWAGKSAGAHMQC